jgi:hypothetical protein
MSDAEKSAASDARTAPVAVWQILDKLRGQDLIDWRLAETKGRASIEERNLDIGFPFGFLLLFFQGSHIRVIGRWRVAGGSGLPNHQDQQC